MCRYSSLININPSGSYQVMSSDESRRIKLPQCIGYKITLEKTVGKYWPGNIASVDIKIHPMQVSIV